MGRSTRRATFKTSEVIALFIIGFFGSMFFFLVLALLKPVLDWLFGRTPEPTTSAPAAKKGGLPWPPPPRRR